MKCLSCGQMISISIFKGTGFCSDLCRKFAEGELSKERYEELLRDPSLVIRSS